MVIDFSKFDFEDRPTLILENPDGTKIGSLGYAFNVNIDFMYNEVSTLNFDLPSQVDGKPVQGYDLVTGMRIVEIQDCARFVLVDPKEEDDGIRKVKTCKAYSLEYEFSKKDIYLEEGTYNFYSGTNVGNEDTIIGRIKERMPDWTFNIDDTLVGKYRTFDESNRKVYDFIKSEVQESYGCIFDFDTMRRVVNVVSVKEKVPTQQVFLSKDALIKKMEVDENSDGIVTCLDVNGEEGVSIRSVNPTGSNKIYNLDYFMQDTSHFEQSLINKWNAWTQAVEDSRKEYYNLTIQYSTLQLRIAMKESEIEDKGVELSVLENRRAIAIEMDEEGLTPTETLEQVNALIATKEAEIDALDEEVDALKEEASSISAALSSMNDGLSFYNKDNFSDEDRAILNRYFFDDTLQDDSFVASTVNSYDTTDLNFNVNGKNVSFSGAYVYKDTTSNSGIIQKMRELGDKYNALVRGTEDDPRGNVDYNARPFVSPATMIAAGWTEFEEEGAGDIATTLTQGETIGSEPNWYTLDITPILEDGTVLTPSELYDYCYDCLDAEHGIAGILASDIDKLVVHVVEGEYDPAYWEPLEIKLNVIKNEHYALAKAANIVPNGNTVYTLRGGTIDVGNSVVGGLTAELFGTPAKQTIRLRGLDTAYEHGDDRFLKVGILVSGENDEPEFKWSDSVQIPDKVLMFTSNLKFRDFTFVAGSSYDYKVMIYYTDESGLVPKMLPQQAGNYNEFECKSTYEDNIDSNFSAKNVTATLSVSNVEDSETHKKDFILTAYTERGDVGVGDFSKGNLTITGKTSGVTTKTALGVDITASPGRQRVHLHGLDENYAHGNDRFLVVAIHETVDNEDVFHYSNSLNIPDKVEAFDADITFPDMTFVAGTTYSYKTTIYYTDGNDLWNKVIPAEAGVYDTFDCMAIYDDTVNYDTSLYFDVSDGRFYFTQDATEYEQRQVEWDLYEYGKQVLADSASPKYTFDVESSNFLHIDKYREFKKQLKLGKRVYLKYGDEVLTPYVVSAHIDFESPDNFSVGFSNTYTAFDKSFDLADLLEQSVSMGKSLSYKSGAYEAFVNSGASSQVKTFMDSALDVARNAVLSSGMQAITFDDSGLHVRKRSSSSQSGYEPEEIWIVDNMIAFTDDNWDTAKMGIGKIFDPNLSTFVLTDDADYVPGKTYYTDKNGTVWKKNTTVIQNWEEQGIGILYERDTDAGGGYRYGIVAPYIVGTMIAGGNLVIESTKPDGENMAFKIDGSGASLYNADFIIRDDSREIVLSPANGIVIGQRGSVRDNGTIDPNKAKFYADEHGNLTVKGTIYGTSGEFSGTIDASDFKIRGTSVLTNSSPEDKTIKGDYINAKGITVTHGNDTTFNVDSSGNVTIRGTLDGCRIIGTSFAVNDPSGVGDAWLYITAVEDILHLPQIGFSSSVEGAYAWWDFGLTKFNGALDFSNVTSISGLYAVFA